MIDMKAKEEQVLSGLKDFQKATVERVFALFTDQQSPRCRVLVADEVGLGKTLVAKGIIAKTALYHQQNNDPIFKVVYVCSNQSIAGQNLAKLKINDNDQVDSLIDTRLSMQHLKIFKDELKAKDRNNYIQLIPLTPNTSFKMTSGCGSVQERALIFAILRRCDELKEYLPELEKLLTDYARTSWKWVKEDYEKQVADCDMASNGKYLETMIGRVENYCMGKDPACRLLSKIVEFLKQYRLGCPQQAASNTHLRLLRRMMAEISIEMIDADLVIMDEFQRFRELIATDEGEEAVVDNDTAVLSQRFFAAEKRDHGKVKILLLSATPYKLYATPEEINENKEDAPYREFDEVMKFLFESDTAKQADFSKVWSDYSMTLNQIEVADMTVLLAKKVRAENLLYQGVCRTERLSVNGADKFISTEDTKSSLDISESDIIAYVQANDVFKAINPRNEVPIEYIKSAPYILSFMEHYKLKEQVANYFKKNPADIKKVRKPELWLKEDLIKNYAKLPDGNARLKRLKLEALPVGSERLIWIPPSKPYYELGGPFGGLKHFSKVLVFSAWEMVPRMIATMLSYEAERRTVGELTRKAASAARERNEDSTPIYFPRPKKIRFPGPRLKFNLRDNVPASMTLMCLTYPCVTLAKLYNPISAMNQGLTKRQIEAELRLKIEEKLSELEAEMTIGEGGGDDWYSLAPLLFDRREAVIESWLKEPSLIPSVKNEEGIPANKEDDEEAGADDSSIFELHFKKLRDIYQSSELPQMGRKPQDLVDILVKMAMASPAVCALRLFGVDVANAPAWATVLAKSIVDRFNSQEATAIVELTYGPREPHWKNALQYCSDGNIQAMLEEYAHILSDDNGLQHSGDEVRARYICQLMTGAIKTHTANYNVDTYEKFRERIRNGEFKRKGSEKGERRYIKMRSGYAAGFYDMRGADKSVQRRDSLRRAFNSPFRPFVLASTSIGQEGLDFHHYCRKIVHWNLPANPTELEQREGRINRYKCLAIRQNVAQKYGNDMKFSQDVWSEIFEMASNDIQPGTKTSEMVPFWCLQGDAPIKIERIVPMYPMSRDQSKYERLMKILSLYRLSLGQARQEELLEYVLQSNLNEEQIKELFINLSPHFRRVDDINTGREN